MTACKGVLMAEMHEWEFAPESPGAYFAVGTSATSCFALPLRFLLLLLLPRVARHR